MKHSDVGEVAVIGIPDKLKGEIPEAFVVLKNGHNLTGNDLRYFCRRHLAHFKIPRYFEFMPMLPKTRTGKVDKEKLKSEFV
jgi:acyl-coenzyme A synthetase/AMP-(fatty) acid ligase